jgi:fermentation-respiration switch protein FrsA (DUF1100 family)
MKKYIYGFIFVSAAVCVLLNIFADKIIFHPVKEYGAHILPVEEIIFAAQDGTELHGIYLPPAPYMDTLLFFHGNTGNVTYFEDFAKLYAKHGFGILIFDYRGFGRSNGKLTQANVYGDAEAAVNYLIKTKNTPPSNIILWGYSFGNAPAVQTALSLKNMPFKALILQSPFTNMPQIWAAIAGRRYAPQSALQEVLIGIFYAVLFDKHYDNIAKIGGVKIPVLVGYSRQDMLIPWEMSAALAAAASEGSQSFLSETGRHASFEWFEKEALAFINKQQ